jgi:hypothetical protein
MLMGALGAIGHSLSIGNLACHVKRRIVVLDKSSAALYSSIGEHEMRRSTEEWI